MREALSVVIITRNEEDEIEECLRSVSWADEIVLVDSHSSDRTVEIARRFTDRIHQRAFSGFTDQKQWATDRARGPWILNIDADERVPEALRAEIEAVLEQGTSSAGFRIPRLTWYLGRFVRHGTWYPDRKLRLFRKDRGRWTGGSVHESVAIDGPAGALRNPILHYSFRTLADHFSTIDRFTRLAAEDLAAKGEGGSVLRLLVHPPATFVKSLILRFGFLDGWRGFLIAALSARHSYLKYARVREALRAKRTRGVER
ncbi:MAG: glycosyltransferase family 2 protein [Candidatus Eisenbacteria bacterium]|nr:glycosyltransferase family 2 protein [Candidatus Eisenbacteria bacterium]